MGPLRPFKDKDGGLSSICVFKLPLLPFLATLPLRSIRLRLPILPVEIIRGNVGFDYFFFFFQEKEKWNE